MQGKNFREDASEAEMLDYAAGIEDDRKGTGQEPAAAAGEMSDAAGAEMTDKAGDSRCPSDWIVVDCFWCATSNCANPRWHVVFCRKCSKPSTY